MSSLSRGKRTTPRVIELHFEDRDGQVRVVPPDKDLMAMPVEMAVEACRAFKEQIRFKYQFEFLIDRLGAWVRGRRHASGAYLTTLDAGLLFLVVLQEKKWNAEIEQALTELDLEIANDSDYSLVNLSVLAIPNCDQEAVESFLANGVALRFTADGK